MKKLFSLSLALFSAVVISACSSDDSSSNADDTPSSSSMNPVMEELSINYELLDLCYIYAHTTDNLAPSVEDYVGKGTAKDAQNANSGEDQCTKDYYDVCYMYDKLKDPFTHYYDPTLAPAVIAELMEPEEEFVIRGIDYVITEMSEEDIIGEVTYVSDEMKEQDIRVGDKFSLGLLSLTMDETKDTSDAMLVAMRGEDAARVTVKVTMAKQPTVAIHYEKTEGGDSIPVIRIREFDQKTVGAGGTREEFAEALKKTKDSKSLIIDLRNNGGGDTDHCNATSAEFLSKGDTITIDIEAEADSVVEDGETKYVQKLDTNVVVTDKDGSAKDRYVVMLADDLSASCAELMLSAIASNKKAPIVGKLTYGKQIGQWVIYTGDEVEDDDEYPDFAKNLKGLAIVTALYAYDKDWKQFQDVGIVPDYEIEGAQAQMKKAVELAAKGTEKRTAGYGTERLGHFAKTAATGNYKASIKDLKRSRYKIVR